MNDEETNESNDKDSKVNCRSVFVVVAISNIFYREIYFTFNLIGAETNNQWPRIDVSKYLQEDAKRFH